MDRAEAPVPFGLPGWQEPSPSSLPHAFRQSPMHAQSWAQGPSYLSVRHFPQALKKGASRPRHLGEASPRRGHVIQLEEWEARLPGEAGYGKSFGGRGRARAKARRDDLEPVGRTEDSVQRGCIERACGLGPQSPEAVFFFFFLVVAELGPSPSA